MPPTPPSETPDSQQQPDLTFDPTRLEPFQLMQANVVEALPEENPALAGPHITLVLVGVPPWAREPKTYLTSVSPKLAVDLGDGLAETGRALLEGPSVQVATPADMHATTKAADLLRDTIRGR